MSNSKNKGTEYELFVKSVYERLLAAEGVYTIKIQHDVILIGAKGDHQIDLYWEFAVAGIVHKVAVECKDYKRRVTIDRIRAFHDTLEDIGGVKGVFATTSGFQTGALEYAKNCGISPFIIHQPTDKDWEGRIMQINLSIKVLSLVNKNLSLGINYDEAKKLGIEGRARRELDTSAMVRYDSMQVKLSEKENNATDGVTDISSGERVAEVITSPEPLISIQTAGKEKLIDILKRCPMKAVGHMDVNIRLENGFMNIGEGVDLGVTEIPVDEMHFSYDVVADEINSVIRADRDVLAIIRNLTNNEETIIRNTGVL